MLLGALEFRGMYSQTIARRVIVTQRRTSVSSSRAQTTTVLSLDPASKNASSRRVQCVSFSSMLSFNVCIAAVNSGASGIVWVLISPETTPIGCGVRLECLLGVGDIYQIVRRVKPVV